jgi:AcrR family transcriptional regulator
MATEKGSRPPGRAPGHHRRKPTPAEAAERVVKKIDAKLNHATAHLDRKADQLDRKAAQLERISAKLQDRQELLEAISGHLGSLEVWTRAEPGGRRPRFSREEIAAAAVRIADAEGFAAVSMRRLATELGAGTMTLYHYVRTKDELLTLINDTVMGEVALPPGEELPGNWREAMGVIAGRSRAALLRHPWMFDITDDPPIGPNSVRHFDQSLQAVSSLDVSLTEKFDIVCTVDEYVFGHCLQERNNMEGEAMASEEMMSYCNALISTGDYPQLAGLVDEHGLAETWALIGAHFRDEGRFERNLARLLDGIEANLPH